jgi:hypothetical protein
MSNIFMGILAVAAILFSWKTMHNNPAKLIAGRTFYVTNRHPDSYSNAANNPEQASILFKKDGKVEYTSISDHINGQWSLNGNEIEIGTFIDSDRNYIDLADTDSLENHDVYFLKFRDGSNAFKYFLVAKD